VNSLTRPLGAIVFLLLTASFSVAAEQYTSPFGQAFVKIKAGEFIMGTQNFDDLAREVKADRLNHLKKELPPHRVRISRDFWLATTEVTQAVWYELMHSKPGREKRWLRKDWGQLPVSNVSWASAQEFIDVLNEMDDGYHYRLPTEAEWEYAARAGTYGLRPFDYADMGDYVWFRGSSGNKLMPVGTLRPNAWGLYDMIGSLWEWVADSFDASYYSVSPVVDPKGPELSVRKVMRGGSYRCTPERARVGIRGTHVEHRSMSVLGFRLAADKR